MDSENKIFEEKSTAVPAAEMPAKKKRRWLKRTLLAFGALLAAILIVVAFFLGPIVEFAVNNFGASFLGVDKCSVASAKIYPFAGHVRFEKILIGKPVSENNAFSHDLFSVDLVDVDVDMSSLLSKKKILERFEILNPTAVYEQTLSGETNVDAILAHIEGDKKSEPETPEKTESVPAEESEDEPTEIFIGARYFVIENVRVSAYLRGVPVVFPAMSADFSEGIGMDKDLTPVEFGRRVAGNFMSIIDFFRKSVLGDATRVAIDAVSDAAVLTGEAAKAATDATISAVSDAATLTGDAAKVAGDVAVGAVSDAAELTGDAAKATVNAVSDAADSVLNLFKSKEKSDDEK